MSLDTNRATRFGITVNLYPRLTEILVVLARKAPHTADHDSIITGIYGDNEPTASNVTNLIKVHISQLRKRIKPLGVSIQSIFGVGYRLEFSKEPT